MVITIHVWRNLSVSLCDSKGEGALETYTCFLLDFTSCAFSPCWFRFVSFHCHHSLNEVQPYAEACWVLANVESGDGPGDFQSK